VTRRQGALFARDVAALLLLAALAAWLLTWGWW
jgi:hypothetical protein